MKLSNYRRLVHIAMLVLVVLVVRACGGAAQAEDRLNGASRWAAERTGLTGVKAALDQNVKPRLAGATSSVTYAIYDGVSRTLDTSEMALYGLASWGWQHVTNVEHAIEARIRSVLTPRGPAGREPQRPGGSASDDSSTPSSSR